MTPTQVNREAERRRASALTYRQNRYQGGYNVSYFDEPLGMVWETFTGWAFRSNPLAAAVDGHATRWEAGLALAIARGTMRAAA